MECINFAKFLLMYTLEEKLEIVKLKNNNMSFTQIQSEFEAKFIIRPIPAISTISRIVSKLNLTGCVRSEHNTRNRQCYVLTIEKKMK
jgi:hypothetical protein